MRKSSFVFVVALVAALLVPAATETVAQNNGFQFKNVEWVRNASVVADSRPVVALKYLGAGERSADDGTAATDGSSYAYASVDIATADVEFFSGTTSGPTAVTAGDEIDGTNAVVGGSILNGGGSLLTNAGGLCDSGSTEDSVLALGEADCDTYKEFVDAINSSGNWRAQLVGALPGDTTAGTDFLDPASANVTGLGASGGQGVDFYGMLRDDSGQDDIILILAPGLDDDRDPRIFFDNDYTNLVNPCQDKRGFLSYANLSAINDGGTGTIQLYSLDPIDLVATEVYSTATAQDTAEENTFFTTPIAGLPNECLMVKFTGNTVVTGSMEVGGFFADIDKP
jgi:hypothetical protein